MTDPAVVPKVSDKSTRWANFAERVIWTLLQAASAEGTLAVWEAFQGDIESSKRAALIVVLTVAYSALKNAAAQVFGSPTGATLPSAMQPVLAEKAVIQTKDIPHTDIAVEVSPGAALEEAVDTEHAEEITHETAVRINEAITQDMERELGVDPSKQA